MARDKLLLVVDKLLGRSRRGEVDWNPAEEVNKFVVSYSLSSFTIESDEAAPNFYRITAINEEGIEVDFLDFQDPSDDDYELVGELYGLVKRKVIRADEVLDTLLEEIDQESPSIGI